MLCYYALNMYLCVQGNSEEENVKGYYLHCSGIFSILFSSKYISRIYKVSQGSKLQL